MSAESRTVGHGRAPGRSQPLFASTELAARIERAECRLLGDPSVVVTLTRRGYVLEGFENVLGRPLPPAEPPVTPEGIEITVGGPDDIASWLDVVVSGFLVPDTQGVASHESFLRAAIEPVMRDFATADGVALYLADAATACCDVAVVTTQPGSKSQQNVQKRGFDLLYTRAVLARPEDPSAARQKA